MSRDNQHSQFRELLILGAIWLGSALCDRLWFALDQSIPAWDQADYLTGSLNYWQALQNPQWFSGEWWTRFWQLSSKVPPLTYVAAAVVQNLFGTGFDQATLVLLLFSAILLGSVYGLGVQLFNRQVGLWAAGLVVLLPGLYRYRLEFLLDYPVTAVVTFSFYCLTIWKSNGKRQTSVGAGLPASFLESPDDNKPALTKVTRQKQESSPHPLSPSVASQWLWAAAFGLSLGLALMVKQTALLFLFVPLLWVGVGIIRHRDWARFAQLVGSLCLSVLVFGFWYRTNWLLMLTAGKRATVDSAIAEGDPALNTLDAWIYYWKILPYLVSWHLLLVPIVGLLIYWIRLAFINYQKKPTTKFLTESKISDSFKWLAVFWVGGYLLCSLNVNKDARYVLPLLPVLSLFFAYGLTHWNGRWGKSIRWGTVSLAILLMVFNLFPLEGAGLTQLLSPRVQHLPYQGQKLPHSQVIEEITRTSPYLRTTLGVLPSTAEINQHNLNYYGALANFQVYGRQVGTQEKYILQDARSLSWFLTKTGNQGSVPEVQAKIVQIVEQGSDFQLHKTWNLPDGSTLKLYHQRQPGLEVNSLATDGLSVTNSFKSFVVTDVSAASNVKSLATDGVSVTHSFNGFVVTDVFNSINPPGEESGGGVRLNRVIVPEKAPLGVPVPVTYEWSGSWQQLQSGIVLLTWQRIEGEGTPQQRWLHDHGIGMGELYPSILTNFETEQHAVSTPNSQFRVIERMAMLPPADILAGSYTIKATYLNRQTGETYPIAIPPVTLTIDPTAVATPAPELDLVTQLRTLATNLPKGTNALEPVFEQTGRINQYDPIQDYLVQADLALEYRLQLEPQNRDWAYGLALSKVLQKDAKGAIAALKRVTQLDPQNPYAYAYLAFVHLYDWHPKQAENALKPALAINPNLSELQALSGVAALLQGNVFKAWQILHKYI